MFLMIMQYWEHPSEVMCLLCANMIVPMSFTEPCQSQYRIYCTVHQCKIEGRCVPHINKSDQLILTPYGPFY